MAIVLWWAFFFNWELSRIWLDDSSFFIPNPIWISFTSGQYFSSTLDSVSGIWLQKLPGRLALAFLVTPFGCGSSFTLINKVGRFVCTPASLLSSATLLSFFDSLLSFWFSGHKKRFAGISSSVWQIWSEHCETDKVWELLSRKHFGDVEHSRIDLPWSSKFLKFPDGPNWTS